MKKILIIFLIVISNNSFAFINNDIVGGCGAPLYIENNHTQLIAVFHANEYTCANGYFLPANTDGCRPCPTGFTCPGGTFVFNETSAQGINGNPTINQNASNLCAKNTLPYFNQSVPMVAIFERNTMTLNFDDGNGNVTSTTCEYGDTIAIPDTIPTRPGYNFAGWVVRQNND